MSLQVEFIETPRLRLNLYRPKDYSNLFENSSAEIIKKELGLLNDEDLEKERTKVNGGFTTYRVDLVSFFIVLKETGETIGSCALHNWQAMHQRSEIGYLIGEEKNRAKGYMSEAIAAILEYGFSNMNLNRVEAFTSPNNFPSIKMLDKFGFLKEGILKQHYIYRDEMHDSVVYALLKCNR